MRQAGQHRLAPVGRRRAIGNLAIPLLLCCLNSPASAQWFDRQSMLATVLIERSDGEAVVPHGTGFLLWNYASPNSPIIVTCAHLLKRDKVLVRVNADSSLIAFATRTRQRFIRVNGRTWEVVDRTLRTEIDLHTLGPGALATDSLSDVGAFIIDVGSHIQVGTDQPGMKFADVIKISASAMRRRQALSLGDELYFVGFPCGIGVGTQLEPVIRSGSVAWLSQASHEFLIDALSYGGNSGSPVFSKAIFGRRPGDASWDAPYLVAMVIGHVSNTVEGVLVQPDPKRPVVERQSVASNIGLVRCVWIDDILKVTQQLGAACVVR